MKGRHLYRILLALTVCAAAPAALAYVGPGAGLSLLGALWGVVLAVVACVGFVLLWPLRRYLRRRAELQQAEAPAQRQPDAGVEQRREHR